MSDLFTPAKPKPPTDPRVHACTVCGAHNAPCGMAGQWFCWGCEPADWRAPERRAA